MSSDQGNPNLEPNSTPTSPQEPTPDVPIPPSTSEPVAVPPVAQNEPKDAESAIPVNNDILEIEPVKTAPAQTAQTDNSSSNESLSEAPQPPMAQIPVNEAFISQTKQSLLVKAREAIQFRKRKKLEKIMGMFLKQASITNDGVEKLLHVSDATATRYLSQLEKEGKIKQEGRTGKSVSYSRI